MLMPAAGRYWIAHGDIRDRDVMDLPEMKKMVNVIIKQWYIM